MTKRSFAVLAGVLGAAALAAPAAAQLPSITPFSFEVRAGAAIPQGDLGDLTELGYSLNGTVTYHFIPMLGIYAGGTYSRFAIDDELVEEGEDGGDITDTGFDAGLRLAIPTPLIPIDPWIKGGLVYHRLSLHADGGEEDDTDMSLGFELGAGLGFGLGPVSITPGVGYVRYSVDDESESDDDGSVSYFTAGVGVRIRL